MRKPIPSLTPSGVFLQSEILNRRLGNNSFVSANDIGDVDAAIICARESETRPIGAEWLDTADQDIAEGFSTTAGNRLFYTQTRPSGIHLFRGGVEFSTEHEGVYACHIDDDDGNSQVLFIGIYTPETLQNTGFVAEPLLYLIFIPTTSQNKHCMIYLYRQFAIQDLLW